MRDACSILAISWGVVSAAQERRIELGAQYAIFVGIKA